MHFYSQEKEKLEKELKAVKNKLTNLSVLRFVVFFATVFSIYLSFSDIILMVIIAVVGIVVFSILLSKYLQLKNQKILLNRKIQINLTELNVLNGDFSKLPNGAEFSDSNHFFSHDIPPVHPLRSTMLR